MECDRPGAAVRFSHRYRDEPAVSGTQLVLTIYTAEGVVIRIRRGRGDRFVKVLDKRNHGGRPFFSYQTIFAVFAGRLSHLLDEAPVEGTQGVETGTHTDIGNAQIGGTQEAAGIVEPKGVDIVVKANIQLAVEQMRNVKTVEV